MVREGIKLFTITPAKALDFASKRLAEETGLSKKECNKLVNNAVMYNCVVDEIVGQAKWLAGIEEDS